jgi:transcriptional antiterminator
MIRKNVLERMYLKDYKTINEIAKRFGTSEFTVSYWIKKHGIRAVERWERYGLNSFKEEQIEYLYGSLLGDDRLNMNGKRKYNFFIVDNS